ncbi:T9SS type A sorting domain-containing protein [Calditrichota bacterium]
MKICKSYSCTAFIILYISLILLFLSPINSLSEWYTDPENPEYLPIAPNYVRMIANGQGGAYLMAENVVGLPWYIFHWDSSGNYTFEDELVPFVSDIEDDHSIVLYESIITSDVGLIYEIRRYRMIDEFESEPIDNRLIKISSEGEFLWGGLGIRMLPDEMYGTDIQPDNDGGCWILGKTYEDYRPLLKHIDGNGDIVFEERVLGWPQGNVYFHTNLLSPDMEGGIFVQAPFNQPNAENTGIYMNHYDFDGDMFNEDGMVRVLPRSEFQAGIIYSAPDHDAMITWKERHEGVSGCYSFRINQNLEFIWDNDLHYFGDSLLGAPYLLNPDPEGGYWYWARNRFDNEQPGTIFFVSDQGETVFSQENEPFGFRPQYISQNHYAYYIQREDIDLPNEVEFYARRIDSAGIMDWDDDPPLLFRYSGDHFSSFLDSKGACSDGRGGLIYLLQFEASLQGGIVGRITQNGNLGFDPDFVYESKQPKSNNLKIEAYPNPFNDQIIFRWNPNTLITGISIYNTLGRNIYHKCFSNNSSQYNWTFSNSDIHNRYKSSGLLIATIQDAEGNKEVIRLLNIK